MTRLLDAILPARTPVRSGITFNDWLQTFAFGGHTYPLSGISQTLHGDREEIDGGFASLVVQALMSNTVVFACETARVSAFAEARFKYRELVGGRPGRLYGDAALSVLENPWTGGVTGDLLARLLIHADFGGAGFVVRRRDEPSRLRVPRPDWITVVMGSRMEPTDPAAALDAEIIGLLYHPGGRGAGHTPEVILPGEFALMISGLPDPLARYRGIPWPSVAAREISGDNAMTEHKRLFLANGATPNMVVSLDPSILQAEYEAWVTEFQKQEPKGSRAYKTLYLGGGAKIDVVGTDLQKLEFKSTQGAGETRIAAAAGVHPVVAGLSEGLAGSSLNAGNFGAARRRFVDLTVRPLWRNASGSLSVIVPPPRGSELWYDDRDVAFLREDAKDRAEIMEIQARTLRALADGGWSPDDAVMAVVAEDLSRLAGRHTGLLSVQLQAPGTQTPDPARALAALIAPHLLSSGDPT